MINDRKRIKPKAQNKISNKLNRKRIEFSEYTAKEKAIN